MWAIILLCAFIPQVLGQATCDDTLNEPANSYLNSDCNYVGICYAWDGENTDAYCKCCNMVDGNDGFTCPDSVKGVYLGTNCEDLKYYTEVRFAFIVDDSLVTCANDEVSPAVPDLVDVAYAVLENYDGIILSQPCEVCSPANPCSIGTNQYAYSGIAVHFGTDLNTHYNHDCAIGETLPQTNVRACSENADYGTGAILALRVDVDQDDANYAGLLDKLDNEHGISKSDTTVTYREIFAGNSITRTSFATLAPSVYPSPNPSFKPTTIPSFEPSPTPTIILQESELPCQNYSHSVTDIKFLGVGSSCRGQINETWPGGQTCESPYLICLPEENTPAEEFLGRTYYSNTHRYNVSQCKQECALDQRCSGFEFRADANSARGDCILIDDIPIQVIDPTYDYDYNSDDDNLDNSSITGDVLCFEKHDYCSPHFSSEDLNERMLACYCPNNRKGSYTKKVKRTVNNTRFCGEDSGMDERIRYAQANRMFHLCENWCLFNAENPESESWYWDPWKVCWRETYAATDIHRGYCDRVIRNPNSIELKFVNARSENLHSCDATRTPTEAPVDDINTTYFLGEEYESCDDACSRNNLTCAAEQTARRFSNETDLIEAFAEGGYTCELDNLRMNSTKWQGWALPALFRGSLCLNRLHPFWHLEDLDSDCHRVIGHNYQRLCACY